MYTILDIVKLTILIFHPTLKDIITGSSKLTEDLKLNDLDIDEIFEELQSYGQKNGIFESIPVDMRKWETVEDIADTLLLLTERNIKKYLSK